MAQSMLDSSDPNLRRLPGPIVAAILLAMTRTPLLLSALLLAACNSGEVVQGEAVTPVTSQPGATPDQPAGARTYALTGFDEIASAGPDRVVVRVGPAFAVRAEGPASVLESLALAIDGRALTITREREFEGPTKAATVYVTLPTLAAASLRGSGAVTIDRMAGNELSATVAGSGDLTIGRAEAGVMTLNLGGSGAMRVTGTATRLEVTTAGSGDVEARGLVAAEARVTVQGSGGVEVTVNGPADVSVIGSGDVTLGGGAQCRTTVAGSGDVSCGEGK